MPWSSQAGTGNGSDSDVTFSAGKPAAGTVSDYRRPSVASFPKDRDGAGSASVVGDDARKARAQVRTRKSCRSIVERKASIEPRVASMPRRLSSACISVPKSERAQAEAERARVEAERERQPGLDVENRLRELEARLVRWNATGTGVAGQKAWLYIARWRV